MTSNIAYANDPATPLDFWTARRQDWADPTVLVTDAQATGTGWAVAEAVVPTTTVAALTRLTSGETALRRVAGAAALALLAARCTDRDRVTVFAATGDAYGANRAVPLSVDVAALLTGRALLGGVRQDYLDVSGHLDISVQALLDEAGARPSDLLFALEDEASAALATTLGCRLRFELRLSGAVPVVRLDHDLAAFIPDTAVRLARAYVDLLGALVTDPAAAVAPLLAAGEDDLTAIAGFNDTAAEFPADRLLHSFLEERAAASDSIAIADDGTTYGRLNAEANRLAHELRARGVRPGDVVGVCVPRSRDLMVAVYGVLKAGGAYLPIDPTLPANRIAYLLDHSRTPLVVAVDTTAAVVAGRQVVRVGEASVLARPDTDPPAVTGPDDPCYVIYTSGSTGRPKGVVIEHRAIVNRIWWMQAAYPLQTDDVVLHKTPFTFDVSVWEIFWWSMAGCAVATLPDGDQRDPERIIERIRDSGATTLHFVPSMLQAFLDFVAASGATSGLDSVRRVFASGEALTVGQVRLFHEQLGRHAELVNLYGPTEAAVDVTHFVCDDPDPALVPIGRPISNISLLVRSRAGYPVPIGVAGELCLIGTGLARGYLHAEDLTRERFVRPDGGERYYRTGDLARWLPDGTIEYLGRIDSQVKIRGFRIELGEIEHVAQQAPGVRQCAVVARTADKREPFLVLYVVTADGYDEAALLAALAGELPSYMVPGHVVAVEAIPTGHNGKRDVSALPMPQVETVEEGSYRAPATPAERELAAIWEQVLGLVQVGVDDNFFNLGGDSISFINVLARARAAGLSFSFQQLFSHPTIAELCAHLERGSIPDAGDTVVPEPFGLLTPQDRAALPPGLDDAYPMSQLQIGLIYEAMRGGVDGLYHDILSYRIHDAVDTALFEQAARALVRRHAILRTSFHLDGYSAPMQLVHEHAAPPLMVFDLTGLPPGEQEEELRRFAERELRGGFQYGTTDLVRVHLHLLGDRKYQYSLSYHDAALDGWSVNTLHRDLFSAYFALLDGGDVAELARPVGSHGRFVALERAAVADPGQRGFWLGLMDEAESTRIPAYTEPAPERSGVGIVDVELPGGLSDGIVATARKLRVPVKTVLMAAHVATLAFLSDSDDVLTGYEHSGRPEVEGGQDIAGLHLNTVPFRPGELGRSWTDLIDAVYRAEQNLLPYRRYPMSEIKKALRSRDALFETVFNFTHFHVLKDLSARDGFELVRSIVNVQSEFPFRAEFYQDAVSDQVLLALHYHHAIYTPEQVGRVGGYYRRALQALVAEPAGDRRAAVLIGERERREMRAVSSGPAYPLPAATFVDLFAAQAARTPSRPALKHGAAELDYAALAGLSDRYAAELADAGVGPGDVVTTMQPRGIAWAATMLALFKLGAVYLPQERTYPVDRVETVLRRSGSRHVVVEPSDVTTLGAELSARVDGLRIVTVGAFAEAQPARAQRAPASGDAAYVIFTSGSTGEPKGATIRHSGMVNHLLSKVLTLGLTEHDRVAQISTQCFDISVWQLLVAWLSGGQTVIYDHETVVDLPVFLRALADDRITVLETVPSYTDALLTEVEQRPFPLPDLRFNIINGEALPPALTRRWFGSYDITAINAYGPTECSDDVTHHVMTAGHEGSRVPVGRPIINTRIHVLGADGRPRPLGSYGEICVTGAGVGLGYLNDSERSAAAFVPNELDDSSPLMYRTGDIGRWLPDGLLDCAGRRDGQVKIRGYRIELSEVDGALDRLDGVDVAVTLARTVGGEKRLVTFYTGAAEPDRQEFRERLTTLLPEYMHPEIVVRLDAFPLNANGKVDRRVLAGLALHTGAEQAREVPETPNEEFVRDLFASVLGLAPAEVGVTDNFFDLGGHSIAAMKVTAMSQGRVVLRDLLVSPTARLIARTLDAPRAQHRDLLVELTDGARGVSARALLVCIPFAGGGAVSYVPVARSLEARGANVRVFGAELPGRTATDPRAEVGLEGLIRQLADEVQARAGDLPVVVLGHCAGAPMALHLTRTLQGRGVPVGRLVIVAKLLRSVDPADHLANEVVHMSEGQILDWLVENTGLDEVGGLTAAQQADLAEAFRHDTVQATRGLHLAVSDVAAHRLDCPATVVLAEDDRLMAGHEAAIGNWGLFVPDTRVVVAGHGGHYLNTTRVDLLADAVAQDLDSLAPDRDAAAAAQSRRAPAAATD